MYICVYMYMYIYMYINIYMYSYKCRCRYRYRCKYRYRCRFTYQHTQTTTDTHRQTNAHTLTHTRKYVYVCIFIYLYRYAFLYLPESAPFQLASAREDRGCGDLPLPHHWPSTPIAVMSVRDIIRCESVTLSDMSSWPYQIRVCDVMKYESVLVRCHEMRWDEVRWGEMRWDDVWWRVMTCDDIVILAAAAITMDTQCYSVRSRILFIIFKSFK